MDGYKLILKRRTVRRFKQKKITMQILKKIIDAARLAPSAANLQFIEYIIIEDKSMKERIFPSTKWAGYLYPSGTPAEGEKPYCYIAVIINLKKTYSPDLRDVGAAVENILLASLNFGIGSCWLGAIDKRAISKILKLPGYCKLDSLVALGYPRETPVVVESHKNIKYWRDKQDQFFVPKRPLRDVLYLNIYGNRD